MCLNFSATKAVDLFGKERYIIPIFGSRLHKLKSLTLDARVKLQLKDYIVWKSNYNDCNI